MIDSIDAIFIDRDGTLGGSDEVLYPGDFELYSYAGAAIDKIKAFGARLYGFTNQPGISRGEATQDAFEKEMKHFGLDEIYICPHHPSEGCECRKPKPGMLLQAASAHGLDLNKCIVIGDRWTDMLAAYAVGCMKILVLTGAGREAMDRYRHLWSITEPDYVAENFEDAVDYILKRECGG